MMCRCRILSIGGSGGAPRAAGITPASRLDIYLLSHLSVYPSSGGRHVWPRAAAAATMPREILQTSYPSISHTTVEFSPASLYPGAAARPRQLTAKQTLGCSGPHSGWAAVVSWSRPVQRRSSHTGVAAARAPHIQTEF